MAMTMLRHFASSTPVAVYVAIGAEAIARVEDLMLNPHLRWVDSPRHASVLLVAGAVDVADHDALRVLHDQLPAPRSTLWWGAGPLPDAADENCLALSEDPSSQLQRIAAALIDGSNRGEPDLRPDEPPAPWRGKGDHGQGGKGMMGGKPYGRPMAMTDADLRDGLELDAWTVRVGPYLRDWPPGLVLECVLQGDVIQHARVVRSPLPPITADHAPLRHAARLLALLELDALAERCRRAAASQQRDGRVDHAALRAAVRRSGAVAAIAPGLGKVGAGGTDSDVRTRLMQWLSGDTQPQAADDVHGELGGLLRGLEWNEARLLINSFGAEQLRCIATVDSEADDASSASATQGHQH